MKPVFALLLSVAACGSPAEGDSCSPGDGNLRLDPERCGGFVQCALVCTGPAGCDGPAQFRWEVQAEDINRTFCDCDGLTLEPELDLGSLPTVRWQFYGSCENPCAQVNLDTGIPAHGPTGAEPVSEECTRCGSAQIEAGECRRSDGQAVAPYCCECAEAELADGECVVSGVPVSVACCT